MSLLQEMYQRTVGHSRTLVHVLCVCVCDRLLLGTNLRQRPVNWGQFVQMESKAVSPVGKNLMSQRLRLGPG